MLFVRFFTNVEGDQKAKDLLEEILEPIQKYISCCKNLSIKPYWKIKDNFVVECLIEMEEYFGELERKHFLYCIAETWQYFGDPVDEALASDQLPGYLKKGVRMINVFYKHEDAGGDEK